MNGLPSAPLGGWVHLSSNSSVSRDPLSRPSRSGKLFSFLSVLGASFRRQTRSFRRQIQHDLIAFLAGVPFTHLTACGPDCHHRMRLEPKPGHLLETKDSHNFHQGVANPDLKLAAVADAVFSAWILRNVPGGLLGADFLAAGGSDVTFLGGSPQVYTRIQSI